MRSLALHLCLVISAILFQPSTENAQKPNPLKIHTLTEKDFNRIVQTDNSLATDAPEKGRLSKKNHKTDKETRAKKTDIFKNAGNSSPKEELPGSSDGGFLPAPKSILSKGGSSATDDYLKGISIGPSTILNSKEYKFYGYFERIREQVAVRWRIKIRKAINVVKKRTKNSIPSGSKITKVNIVLNNKGELLKVEDMALSGYEEFDACAHEAFTESQPYTHPPLELLKDGVFSFTWDFTVNVEEAPIVSVENR